MAAVQSVPEYLPSIVSPPSSPSQRIVGVHVSAVMLVVVELHDLAGDGWLECAIVVCKSYNASAFTSIRASRGYADIRIGHIVQGRSGSVALFL